MNSLILAGIIFGLVFGSALVAGCVRGSLTERHLSSDAKDATRLSVSLVATMVALVLSLLIASAKNAYDMRQGHLVQLSSDVVLLDRELARYGPETKEARSLLHDSMAATIERYWPSNGAPPSALIPRAAASAEALYDRIEALSPTDSTKQKLRDEALSVTVNVGRTTLLLFGSLGSAIPGPFLIVLVFWLCIIFASYGLFAPRNGTVTAVLCVCALSVSTAIFLILELDRPIGGLLQVSGDPLRAAVAQLGR